MSEQHQKQNAAIREQFGKQAPAYAGMTAAEGNRGPDRIAVLMQALGLSASDRVLDIGCGPGRLTLSLAKCAAHATGIDITPEMLEQARALQAKQGATNVTWHQGDILPLPFADASFSVVVTQATFHHLADPAAVLAEMKRVCVQDGRVAVIDLTPAPEKADAFNRIEKLRDPSHVRARCVDELRELGRIAGLEEIERQSYVTRFPAELVLAGSFPASGDLDRIRTLYREDAASGEDRYGLALCLENGELMAGYPMTMFVWRR